MAAPDPVHERRALARSIGASTALGLLGIGWGLAAGSQLIVLDGAYAFIGVAVSWLLMLASRVVGIGPTRHYPFGREALTPLVVGIQGFVLLGTVAYAAVEAVSSILEGGARVAAGWALAYAVVSTIGSFTVWRYLTTAAPGSDLVAAEAAAWKVSTLLGVGMVVGFALLAAIEGTAWDDAAPYVDPVLVLVTSALLVPAPVQMVRSTYVELLEGEPPAEVRDPVQSVIDALVAERGLEPPEVRMTKIGAKLYVEVDGTAPRETTIAVEDELRTELDRRLDRLPFDVWLNFELFPERGEPPAG